MVRLTQTTASLSASLSGLVCWTMLTINYFHINMRAFTFISAGQIIGALTVALIMEYLGKRRTMIAFSIPCVLCWIVDLVTEQLHYAYIVEFVKGAIFSILSICVPIYIGEIAHHSTRGTLAMFYPIFCTLGMLLVSVLNIIKSHMESYIVLAIVYGIVSVVYLCGTLLLPESPIDLLRAGKEKQARSVLKGLRDADYDEQEEIEETLRSFETTYDKCTFRALMTGFGLQIGHRVTGIYELTGVVIFAFDIDGAVLLFVSFVAICIACGLVDRIGRKPLLVSSALGMGVCLTMLSIIPGSDQIGEIRKWLVGLISTVYVIMYSIGFGSVVWVMIGELFAPKIKNFASSAIITTYWILGSVMGLMIQSMYNKHDKYPMYLIYAVICFALSNWMAFFVVETKGKTLKQIQDKLAS